MKNNDLFRQWTRGVSFQLSMGKYQTACLISIFESPNRQVPIGHGHKLLAGWIGGARGLMKRGLIIHHPPKRGIITNDPFSDYRGIIIWANDAEKNRNTVIYKVKDIWEITEAGKLVIGLLKIAGVYQEIASEFYKFEKLRNAL